ncbi:hypothetical protein [Microvirga puerhi]|uniref:Uncharacterized protein n=1 Tax=Microvirga puerhi TaxID=2876078 RepID=A0ABS7VIE1_9HYPH|nr:hypothetical protein [Microvirga puerhi]MBZ6075296.1 hypothetical protein [Microvirga puerhi]
MAVPSVAKSGRLVMRGVALVLWQINSAISFIFAALLAKLAGAGVGLFFLVAFLIVAAFVSPDLALIYVIFVIAVFPALLLSILQTVVPATLVALPVVALIIPKRRFYRYLILPVVGASTGSLLYTVADPDERTGAFFLLYGILAGVSAGAMFANALTDWDTLGLEPSADTAS